MSVLPNNSENNEQILNDIQSLQKIEQELFNNLEADTNLTTKQQQQIIEKMNKIATMRINLYETLSGINNFYGTALNASTGTLKQQASAIGIVESELNKSKKRLQILEAEKNNKIRLVEINSYYGDKYAEHSQLMKIIIFTLVPIIIITFLNNKGIIPSVIFNILIAIIAAIGAYYMWSIYASIIMRDNMNYQEYDFFFNPNTAPKGSSSNSGDPWLSLNAPGSCIGEYCCSTGQTWDPELNQCIGASTVILPESKPESKPVSKPESKPVESFVTTESMSMINDVLTKKQTGKYKDDVNIGNLEYSLTNSFINQ
jgi:hypothetical protein